MKDLEDNKFEENGITFHVIEPARIPEVLSFLDKHFLPDEPVCRSLNVKMKFPFSMVAGEAVKSGASIMAVKDGEIIGVRLAEIISRSDYFTKMFEKMFFFLLPKICWLFRWKNLRQEIIVFNIMKDIFGYDCWKLHEELACDKIHNDLLLCTSSENRVRGLGTELVKRGEDLGEKLGCTYTAAMVTGNYSARIFRKLGYDVKAEIVYNEFRDENGDLYLNDVREHYSCLFCVKKIGKPMMVID